MRRVSRSFTVEVRRSGRQERVASLVQDQPWPGIAEGPAERLPEPVEALSAVIVPIGRVLPALDDSEPVAPKRQKRRYTRRAEKLAAVPEVVGRSVVAEIAVERSAEPVVEPAAHTPASSAWSLPRLPRSAFPPGERWKARLPAVFTVRRRSERRPAKEAGR